MSNVIQDAQHLFTEFLAKMFTNPTFAGQAVGNFPGALQSEGIPESALPYLNVQQAVIDACGYPGVPSGASAAITPAYTAPSPPPQTYTELVQQLQVVNNYVNNEIIDNSTDVTIGANFGTIDIATDNDVTQVGGDNEGAIGDNNEVANLTIDASGGSGGPAFGGDATGQGGFAGSGPAAAVGGDGGDGGYGTGAGYPPYGGGGDGGPGGPGGFANSQASADGIGGIGGDAISQGGNGGIAIPVINFGDDIQEAGPGDQNLGPAARYDHDDHRDDYDDHSPVHRQDDFTQQQQF